MDDFGWMVHDGAYRAVIWPFRTREEALAWRGEFCLGGFVVEQVRKRADAQADPPAALAPASPGARPRRSLRHRRRGTAGRSRRR
jgi:hypothetical protein